jgi:hypothetical protein
MPITPSRIGIVLINAALALFGAIQPAAAEPPMLPAATVKARKPAPFCLEYLVPERCEQGIVAIRPAALARLFAPLPADNLAAQGLRMFLPFVVDIDLDAAKLPALANIEQIVSSLNLQVNFPTEHGQGTFMMGAGSPLCVRTVRPFNWSGRLAKWFPKAERITHEGKQLLTVPCKLSFGTEKPLRLAFLVADERTLVCGTEDDVGMLIDHLKEGKTGVTPPPGWNEVSHNLAAMAFDTRKRCWYAGDWPADCPEMSDGGRLARDLAVVCLGLSVGKHASVRLVARTKDPQALADDAAALEGLLTVARTELKTGQKDHPSTKNDKLVAAWLGRATIRHDAETIRAVVPLPGDFLTQLFEQFKK